MKNLIYKSFLCCLAAVFLWGCKEPAGTEEPAKGKFALEIKTVDTDFVEVAVTAPSELEMAYLVSKEPQALSPAVLFVTGTTLKVSPGQVLKITEGVEQNTSYYLYAVAKLDAQNYSEIIKLEFTTKGYEFKEMLTVVDTYLDGFKVHVTIPEETRNRGNVIRYGTTSLAWYNLMKGSKGGEAVDINAVVANGNPYGNYVKNDSTIIMNNWNIVLLDDNGNPVLDGNGEQIDIHDPISPGEPTIFIAGECRWGSPDEFAQLMGFNLPERDAYIIPLYDWNSGWTGAFQKIEFFTKEPAVCDGTVEIEIPEDEITPVDAMIYFNMGEGVSNYFYMVLDNATYNQLLDTYLDGHEEWFQWFLTSYIAFYEFGVFPESESTYINAASKFFEPLSSGKTYHVLCTVFGDEEGASQRFIHETFTPSEKTKGAPVIEVTAVENGDPYNATFNVKAPNKDVIGVYWACNYARDFELMFNAGSTYESLLKGNYSFSSDEIALINSDEGLEVFYPTLDGETTRLAVYGFNDEYTFNFIDEENEGAGWADYYAPMAEKVAPISSPLFEALEGDWTATATMLVKEQIEDGTYVSYNIDYSSKITISNTAPELPAKVDEYVYDLYKGSSRDDVDSMFEELVDLTDRFTEYRLEGQNRLLCNGFLDFDYFKDAEKGELGRLDYRTPYDLFQATDYASVDIPQLIYDFGPKWFLEVRADGSVIVPFNATYLPPLTNWPGYPFYICGLALEDGLVFLEGTVERPGFPVEVAPDYSKITIKPIVVDGQNCYMNAVGSSINGLEIIASITSEIVLTKGWKDTRSAVSRNFVATPSKVSAASFDGSEVKLPAKRIHKSMTELKAAPVRHYKEDKTPNVVTMDMVNQASSKILKYYGLE